jgi:hypothetical protein
MNTFCEAFDRSKQTDQKEDHGNHQNKTGKKISHSIEILSEWTVSAKGSSEFLVTTMDSR